MRRLSTEAASEASAWRRWTTPQPDSVLPRSAIAYAKDVDSVLRLVSAAAAGSGLARLLKVANPAKRFVYIMRSVNHPRKRYIGVTADVSVRVGAHNAGQNRSTAPWKPWFVDVCIEFRTEQMAVRFEKYLKSGSGHAFASRHFCEPSSNS